MKSNVLTLLLLLLVFSSCKKGRKLPSDFAVNFTPLAEAVVTPTGNFAPFDPNDASEEVVSPRYVSSYQATKVAEELNKSITDLLKDNRIQLVDSPQDYELKLTSASLEETVNRYAYFDSCKSENRYYYQSFLQVSVSATLYYKGTAIDSWTRTAKSQETLRGKRDQCNCPKIRRALRGPEALLTQATKELRVQISKKLYYELYEK